MKRSRFSEEQIIAILREAEAERSKRYRKVVERVCQAPAKGLSRWSVRTLAQHLKMPFATVGRILREQKLYPHRLRTLTFSPDPQFGEKLLKVVAPLHEPTAERSGALHGRKNRHPSARSDATYVILASKKPRSWTNEYVRHGTRTVLASLDITTGKVIAHVRKRRTSKDFLAFMDSVVKEYPDQRLYVVLDNLNTHTNDTAREWLEANPQVSFHYTPTQASWVNLIECFFSILTRQGLQQAVHKSVQELERFLKDFIQQYNHRCGPFEWTKGPEKLRRIIELTEQWQTGQYAAYL